MLLIMHETISTTSAFQPDNLHKTIVVQNLKSSLECHCILFDLKTRSPFIRQTAYTVIGRKHEWKICDCHQQRQKHISSNNKIAQNLVQNCTVSSQQSTIWCNVVMFLLRLESTRMQQQLTLADTRNRDLFM